MSAGAGRPVAELVDDLRALGVREGELLMVHASLRRIGAVRGGADGVVAAVDAALGDDGTWMMILGADDPFDWVNQQRPEADRAAVLLDGAEPFDHLRTPSSPEVGTLAEVVRTSAGTVVNDHPEARFAVRGPLAAELLVDAPFDDYYGPGSPLARLVARRGRILRMGANPDTVTALHHAEYLAEVPDKLRVRRHRLVSGPGGPEVVVVECLDDEDGIVAEDAQPDEDYFAVILGEFLGDASPREATVGRVGDATAELIDAAAIVAFGAEWMTRHFGGGPSGGA